MITIIWIGDFGSEDAQTNVKCTVKISEGFNL